jgi:hypothetical protein
MYEAQIAQLSQQTFNMESAALATENLRNTMATVDAMQIANKEMRKQYGKLDVDQIEVSEAQGALYARLLNERVLNLCGMEDRIFITIWKTYWNKPMKFKQH